MTTPALSPAPPLAAAAGKQTHDMARIAKAAEDFTAVALGALLKPMFEAADDDSNPFGGGAGEKAWRPMMVDEIAKSIARQGGFGLSAPVAQAMLQMQEKAR
jgi:Rod binding domain-containing protein